MVSTKAAKRKPFAGLMLFVALGLFLGFCVGLYLGAHHEQEMLKQYGGNPGIDVGDAYPWFLFLGLTTGGFLGLAAGIARYVVVKRTESESHLSLNLGNK